MYLAGLTRGVRSIAIYRAALSYIQANFGNQNDIIYAFVRISLTIHFSRSEFIQKSGPR